MSEYKIVVEVHMQLSECQHNVMRQIVFADNLSCTSAEVLSTAIEKCKTQILKAALAELDNRLDDTAGVVDGTDSWTCACGYTVASGFVCSRCRLTVIGSDMRKDGMRQAPLTDDTINKIVEEIRDMDWRVREEPR